MMNSDYQRYAEETLKLAHSIVIKSDAIANQMNDYIESIGHNVSNDPREWRYYQHLSGEYHYLDEPMVITSLDTLEDIILTKDILEEHPVTLEFYYLGSRQYLDLVAQYPEQEQLIRGILYPIDMERIIEAPDYTILDYDKNLVEVNETNLIPKLQQRINHFKERWNVPGYHQIDDLFTTAHLGIMFLQLPSMLFNIRLENCHTPYAHGFHIREFLKSHGRLDRFYPFMTRGQQLFLYRNIRYIQIHAGKQSTFHWLKEKLLTDRNIGLAEFHHHHDTRPLNQGHLTPQLEFLRQGLNIYHRSTRSEFHSLEDLLEKQRPVARGNQRIEKEYLQEESERLVFTSRNTYPTKVLESSIIDASTGGYVTLVEVLFNHWIHWSLSDQYQTFIRIPHPQSGQLLQLTPKDTVYLYWYCMNRSWGHTPSIPIRIRPKMLRKSQRTNFEQMRAQVDSTIVPESLIQWFSKQPTYHSILRSPRLIGNAGRSLHRDIHRQREAFSLQEDYRIRGYAEGMFWSLYETREYDLFSEYEMLDEWHFEKGFDVENLSQVEYEEFSAELFAEASGLNQGDEYTLSEIQRALIDLFSSLSSYSVQFIREVNQGPIRFMDRLTTRLGQIEGEGRSSEYVTLARTYPQHVHHHGIFRHNVDVNQQLDVKTHMKTHHRVKMDMSVPYETNVTGVEHVQLRMPIMDIELDED